jgi:proteic killer suppression protein
MIRSFADGSTERFWRTGKSKGMPPAGLRAAARRKLVMLESATRLQDLELPPGNRLEALRHKRAGQHSIRINDQFRVCFVFREGDAYDAEITDYH